MFAFPYYFAARGEIYSSALIIGGDIDPCALGFGGDLACAGLLGELDVLEVQPVNGVGGHTYACGHGDILEVKVLHNAAREILEGDARLNVGGGDILEEDIADYGHILAGFLGIVASLTAVAVGDIDASHTLVEA